MRKDNKIDGNEIVYKTGRELEEYINSSDVCRYNRRDFVERVVNYCKEVQNSHKVYGVSGLSFPSFGPESFMPLLLQKSLS